MKFGPVPPRKMPEQDSLKVLLLAERWQRAAQAQSRWAEKAKRAFDFFEGRQYTAEQIAKLKGRPSLVFNNISPLVRLVLGYQASHKNDIVCRPGQDARSSERTAEALTRVLKSIAAGCKLEYTDVEVFLDGLVGGRGFFDTRLNFDENDFGEIVSKAADPFSTFPDPDADTYDLNESASYIQSARMVSIDEIEGAFGRQAMELITPFTSGRTPLAPLSSLVVNDQITPLRTFGEAEDLVTPWWDQFYSLSGDFVDTYRKTIRLLETQYKVYEVRNVIIDLETGDKKVLPENWDDEKVRKVLLYCESLNNPCIVQPRRVERVHWTITAGDLILYDKASMYDKFTQSGYFPYFRRGMTRGMVEDLIDPQMEKNKRRNARIEIVSRTANGGWMYHEDSLDPREEQKLRKFGAMPGVNIKWKGVPDGAPKPIDATGNPMKHERLEHDSDNDMRSISGINESALGELDRVQSGRAIEARQRQAVLAIQPYIDNFNRTKELVGGQQVSVVQNHYTEQRFFRTLGDDGKFTQLLINQQQADPYGGGVIRVLNDVTVGKYVVSVDNAPISATFLNAQFEEMLTLLEKMGPAMANQLPFFADLIIDMSSMPRKDEWIERFKALMGAQQQQQAAAQQQQQQGQHPQGGQQQPPPQQQPQRQLAAPAAA